MCRLQCRALCRADTEVQIRLKCDTITRWCSGPAALGIGLKPMNKIHLKGLVMCTNGEVKWPSPAIRLDIKSMIHLIQDPQLALWWQEERERDQERVVEVTMNGGCKRTTQSQSKTGKTSEQWDWEDTQMEGVWAVIRRRWTPVMSCQVYPFFDCCVTPKPWQQLKG